MSQFIIHNKGEARKLLLLAILAGRIMLRNGAETYRVEDTIERIIKSRKNIKYADAFVTPTGIFASLEYEEEVLTYLIRIKAIRINLNKIKLFVIDDAEMVIKHGLQGQIDRLALSLPKCQHLVFTNDLTPKIEKLIEKFIVAPIVIEVEE